MVRSLVTALLLLGGAARADGPPCSGKVETLPGAPSLELEVDDTTRRLGPGAPRDQTPVALVRPARAETIGGVRFAAGSPLYLRCPPSGEPEPVLGYLGEDTLLGGVLYPEGTAIGFRGRKVAEAGLTEPAFIAGWRFPAWSIVRFDAGGALASARTTAGDDELPAGESCFFSAGARSVRLHGARDCAAAQRLELGRTRFCGVELPAGDAIELRAAGPGAWLIYLQPSADVVVQGVPFLHGQRLALECPLGGGSEGPGRLRLGTLAAPARFRGTLWPALTQLVDRPGGGGVLRVRLPIPLTVRGVRWPAETVLELDPAGRPRRP